MNLALGAIILFLLFAPGISFRLAYLKSDALNIPLDSSVLGESLLLIVPTTILQFLGYGVVEGLVGRDVRLDQLYFLIIGESDPQRLQFPVIEHSIFPFLIYIVLLSAAGYGLGKGFQWLVSRLDLDRRGRALSLGNYWYYLFSGRMEGDRFMRELSMVQIDVLCESNEGMVIYSGLLDEYYLNKNKQLDRIFLRNVYRRRFKDDLFREGTTKTVSQRMYDERYYKMPGDYLVIPYREIRNLNITYYKLEKVEDTADKS